MTRFIFILLCAWTASTCGAAAQSAGQITCRVSNNGRSADGGIRLIASNGREAGAGPCGDKPIAVPPGSYTAVLNLDGVLDSPEQRLKVQVSGGRNRPVVADFQTGTLRIAIEQNGRLAAGMATIERDGQRVGTLGGGVKAHLSTGTYSVIVRYRDQERRFERVVITTGSHRDLKASF